jgi:hypothetical protein
LLLQSDPEIVNAWAPKGGGAMAEKGDSNVPVGKKIEADEAKKLDPAKMGVALTGRPQTPEVEGQARFWTTVQCPWCASYVRILYDTDRYLYYQCGWCGGWFRM